MSQYRDSLQKDKSDRSGLDKLKNIEKRELQLKTIFKSGRNPFDSDSPSRPLKQAFEAYSAPKIDKTEIKKRILLQKKMKENIMNTKRIKILKDIEDRTVKREKAATQKG